MSVSRNCSVANGERDRPGRTSRRPADCTAHTDEQPLGVSSHAPDAFGETPKAAGGTPALPTPSARFRLRVCALMFVALVLSVGLFSAAAENPFAFESTPGKLPKNVVPRHYAIHITPD